MVDVEAGHLVGPGITLIVGWVGTLFLARSIHKAITGEATREDKPRWTAANGAGIAFFVTGLLWSPDILFKTALVVTGRGSDAFEVALLVFMMAFWTVIGGLIGFGIGRLRS